MTIRTVPLLQVLIFAALMSVLAFWLPMYQFNGGWTLILSVILVIIGIALIVVGGAEFRRCNTTVNPIYPHKTCYLVTRGLYSVSRNPMYLGFLVMLIGWGFYLGDISNFIILPIFVYIMNRYQIMPEERVLGEKFGQAYIDYITRVRRWL